MALGMGRDITVLVATLQGLLGCLGFDVRGRRALLARERFKITVLLEVLHPENAWRNLHTPWTCWSFAWAAFPTLVIQPFP